MSKDKTARIPGDELNERLDGQMLAIERTGILLEDAKVEPAIMLSLDQESLARLLELLSAYETFLEHFKDTTADTVAAIRALLGVPECQHCETDNDLDNEDAEDGNW